MRCRMLRGSPQSAISNHPPERSTRCSSISVRRFCSRLRWCRSSSSIPPSCWYFCPNFTVGLHSRSWPGRLRMFINESDANIVLTRSDGMDYDHDKVDEMVLALLYLTISEESDWGARAWKSHDWDAMDRLHAKGFKIGRASCRERV